MIRERDQLQLSHDTLKTAHQDLTKSSDATTTELESLRKRLTDAETALTESVAQVGTLEAAAAAAKGKHDTLKSQLAKETKRAEAAHTSREALLAENQGLLSQLEEMRERNGQIMKELVELGEERDGLASSVSKLEVRSR